MWALARVSGLDQADALATCQLAWLRLRQQRHVDLDHAAAQLIRAVHEESVRLLRRRRDAHDTSASPPPPIDLRDETSPVWQLSARSRALLVVLTAEPPLSYREVSFALDMPIGSIGPTRSRFVDALRSDIDGEDSEIATVAARQLQDSDPPPAIDLLAPEPGGPLTDEVAEVAEDSDRPDGNGGGDISLTAGRLIRFAGRDVAIEMIVREQQAARDVFGRTSRPSELRRVEAWGPAGPIRAIDADPHRGFELTGLPGGPLAVRLELAHGRSLETAWIRT